MLKTVVTAVASSVVTVILVTTFTPQRADTAEKPIVIVDQQEQLYPATVGSAPQITFESHEAFLADYEKTREDLLDLRHAIDYAAAHGEQVSPSLHEWADNKPPGTFGGGRKP